MSMGYSYEQIKAWGLEHIWPPDLPKTGKARLPTLKEYFPGLGRKPVARTRPDDGMNKTERAFAETLVLSKSRGLIDDWEREPFKVRLAGRTWYTPDFLVWPNSTPTEEARTTFAEVKGFMRDDAAVKLKIATRLYPRFRWLLVYREGRHGWEVREVTRTGIGTTPIHVPWIT
jgi:hypothetical protein